MTRVGVTTIIPLALPSVAGSSDRPGSSGRAVLYRAGNASRRVLPYLVLLRAGFCLPPMLPPARCALTAPFHPYLFAALKGPRYVRRGDRPPYGATGHAT